MLGKAVGFVPVGGPEVELRDQVGLDATELAGEELAVQGVVAIPLAPPVERHQELVGGLEVPEVGLRVRSAEDGIAERTGQLVEDRGAAQELLDVLGLSGERLPVEVVGDEPVIAGDGQSRVSVLSLAIVAAR